MALPAGGIACAADVKTDIVGRPNGNAVLPREVPFGKSFSTMVLRVAVAQNEKPSLKTGLDGPGIVIRDEVFHLYDTHISSYKKNKAYVDPTGNYPLVMDCYYHILEQMLSRNRDIGEVQHAKEFMQLLDEITSVLERMILPKAGK